MEKLFELTFQDQTLNPQVGTFTDASQTTGTFTLEDGEYYLTNGDTKGFYTYAPIAIQPDSETDNKVTVEFDLKVVTASVNTHTIIGTYAGVDGSGIPTGAKITLQYNAGDIELVLGSGATETLIAAADVVVGQWYHFRIDCALDAPTESTYQVKIDGVSITTVTGATTDYELGIISVLGTDLHACDECGIKNIRLITNDDYFVGRTALNQAFKDVKGYVDTTKIPLAGSNQISGSLIPATDNAYDLGGTTYGFANIHTRYVQGSNTQKELSLFSSNNAYDPWNHGACISLYTNDYSDDSARIGTFSIRAQGSGNNTCNLIGTPSGALTWGTKNVAMQEDVIPRSGGAVISGNTLGRIDDTDLLYLNSGSTENNGGHIVLFGAHYGWESGRGTVRLNPALSSTTQQFMYLYPDGTWTWDGSAIQYVSDKRLKQQIAEIDDKLLDAWEDVNLVQFKYNDAVEEKSDNARLHTGYVVQQIDEACKKHNVDVSKYGLYCHEEYAEETREVEHDDGTKTIEVVRPASEHYSLRYTEALIVECAYLRKKNKELQEQIDKLSARLDKLESASSK